MEKVQFLARAANGDSTNVILLPLALAQVAMVSQIDIGTSEVPTDNSLALLTIPATEAVGEAAISAVGHWVGQTNELDVDGSEQAILMLNLQHVQVFWSPRRIAIIAQGERMKTVRDAIVKATYYIRELKAIEKSLAEMWPDLENDTPLAFEFLEQDRSKQKQLLQRFQETISLRARLARVTPFLLAPHAYPPTLASQVSERLRERFRVHEQVEFVSDQIEVFEKVYEMCGQRSSDFQQARTGHILEWIIIVLLSAEVILLAFDYLSTASATTAATTAVGVN